MPTASEKIAVIFPSISKGRTKESLRIYDALVREGSMTEADKDRIKENIRILKQ